MLKTLSLAQRLCSTCLTHTSISTRSFAITSCNPSGFKKYNRFKDSVRQAGVDTSADGLGDHQPLQYDKTYGGTSFPTLETHSQVFDGMKYTDVPVVHVKATSNNTILTVASDSGVLALQSAGTVGFRNARKGTNVAAQAAAIALASDALRKDVKTVRVCLKGIGPGRLPALKALQMSGLKIISITDTTPLPFNGCRPKKKAKTQQITLQRQAVLVVVRFAKPAEASANGLRPANSVIPIGVKKIEVIRAYLTSKLYGTNKQS
ncbi:30S ribosomal protein s11 [Plakobranchus ocellatus]|uniref:30S ribosomal protein s11 n=1 Tax=Plakobranchus ocellatus TaxID=259542 RepID=A0AAV4B291_9GAST|nr:30S ribosomal protein s11 [Plakobranchus ocellatus]